MKSLFLISCTVLSCAWASPLTLAPLYDTPDTETITDSYIVVLKDQINSAQVHSHCTGVNDHAASLRVDDEIPLSEYLDADAMMGIQHTYVMPEWRGYSGRFSSATLDHIRRQPEVAYVERDTVVYASEMQRNAPWGLARVSHRDTLSLRTFSKYEHDPAGGEGVSVFVIDTGIHVAHNDFGGRATWGVTIPNGDADDDGNGHGSHCAGTIAGRRYGIAKRARPVAVKVLSSNGSGSMSGVLAGVNWAVEQHAVLAQREGKAYKGAVANMSLGGGKSRALDRAVDEAVRSGIVFSVAAGNDNRDACNYSPAASELAITVGASNIRDERASFSNHGKCVDVFAPGENILSVWTGSSDGTNTISGTSMASPHVAGLAAYFLSQEKELVDPKVIKDKILELATPGRMSNLPKGTPNLLIYNGYNETKRGAF